MNRTARCGFVVALVAGFALVPALAQKKPNYRADVKFAIDAIGKQCKVLLESKGIHWKKVTAPLLAEGKKTKTNEQHLLLLWRLLARLQDGHAQVKPLELGKGVKVDWPQRWYGPGLFLCRIGGDVYIKNAWGPAASANLKPGMQVLEIAGEPAGRWLEARTAVLSDLISFSTPHQAEFYTCHWGMADVKGTRVAFEVIDGKAKKKRKVTYGKLSQTASGPAFRPESTRRHRDIYFSKTPDGFGYIHVRRCKSTLPEQIDTALAELGEVPGMILDFRGNGGGGFDHRALFGRFLPRGTEWRHGSGYKSAGETPFGGPMVVIVDATCRSAGETGAGQFTEDGRAYGIGESPTAGMSSSKTTIELPSQLFALYVSVRSNKARFQGGKGIEGIGVVPHELVEFDPEDLAAGRDTLVRRAETVLRGFAAASDLPERKLWKEVRYDPGKHGWQARKQKAKK